MDKIRLLTPPGDTAHDSERWYELAIFLSRHCELSVSPVMTASAEEFQQRLPEADLIYCAPELVPKLIREFRFGPLMQPVDTYEEVVIISGPAATIHRIKGIHDSSLGGIKGTFANRLGLTTLTQKQIKPASINYFDNWLQLLKAVQQGKQPYALVSKHFIEQLSPLSLTAINQLARSHLCKAFPLLMHSPEIKPHAKRLRAVLQGMKEDPKGRVILEKLKNQGWKKPSEQSIIDMVKILRGK